MNKDNAAIISALVLLCKQLAERFPDIKTSSKFQIPNSNLGHTLAQSESSSQACLDNAKLKQGHGSEYFLNIHGHNEYSIKRCPCFDVQEERNLWGI